VANSAWSDSTYGSTWGSAGDSRIGLNVGSAGEFGRRTRRRENNRDREGDCAHDNGKAAQLGVIGGASDHRVLSHN
jgi:hypothetical protein